MLFDVDTTSGVDAGSAGRFQLGALSMDRETRLEAYLTNIAQVSNLAELILCQAYACHNFAVKHRQGRIDPGFWQQVFDALHARQIGLLQELAAQAVQASDGASVAAAIWPT